MSTTEKRRGWWADINGQATPVSEVLSKLGAEGWELVTAVVGQDRDATSPGITPWYYPDHWLYFKRPKP